MIQITNDAMEQKSLAIFNKQPIFRKEYFTLGNDVNRENMIFCYLSNNPLIDT